MARPALGRINPSSIRIVVVLPDPLGPRKPKTSPRITWRFKSLTATRFPNALVNLVVLITVLSSYRDILFTILLNPLSHYTAVISAQHTLHVQLIYCKWNAGKGYPSLNLMCEV